MRILAIETSGPAFSVALAENGSVTAEIFLHAGFTHSAKMVPALRYLLKEVGWGLQDIDKIAVSTGPGSFTGIRIGLACARVLAQSLRIPLTGVTSLDILANGVPCGKYDVYPAIDALRGEVFVKSGKSASVIGIARLIGDLKARKRPVILVGSAVPLYEKAIACELRGKAAFAPDHMNFPRAGILALIAAGSKGEHYEKVKPLYVRKSWAEEKKTESK